MLSGQANVPGCFPHDRRHLPTWSEIEAEIGPEPIRADCPEGESGESEFEAANDGIEEDFQDGSLQAIRRAEDRKDTTRFVKGRQSIHWIHFLALMSALESDLGQQDMNGTRLASVDMALVRRPRCSRGSSSRIGNILSQDSRFSLG